MHSFISFFSSISVNLRPALHAQRPASAPERKKERNEGSYGEQHKAKEGKASSNCWQAATYLQEEIEQTAKNMSWMVMLRVIVLWARECKLKLAARGGYKAMLAWDQAEDVDDERDNRIAYFTALSKNINYSTFASPPATFGIFIFCPGVKTVLRGVKTVLRLGTIQTSERTHDTTS